MRTRKLLCLIAGLSLITSPALSVAEDAAIVSSMNAKSYSFPAIDSTAETPRSIPLYHYKDKVLLVVNTASQCGFTPQYEGLQQLWEKYKDRGLVVIGVPSNNFGGQEPGSDKDIQKFTSETFKITFPLTAKVEVTGDKAHPFFRYVQKTLGFMAVPKWNFYKYLIDKEGNLVDYFPSTTKPMSPELTNIIEKLLSTTENPR